MAAPPIDYSRDRTHPTDPHAPMASQALSAIIGCAPVVEDGNCPLAVAELLIQQLEAFIAEYWDEPDTLRSGDAHDDAITGIIRRIRLTAEALPAADHWTGREHLANRLKAVADDLAEQA